MRIERVLAPNAGLFTGAGTNTWLLESGGFVVVIDPGPRDSRHHDTIVERVGERTVASVIVTHTHEDHAPLANPLASGWGVPTAGFGRGPQFEPDLRLAHGSKLEVGDVDLEIVHTPGHSDDHLCFLAERVLFTGDHIMGGSSVMVEDMGAYLSSLERVRGLAVDALYPGHGDIMDDPEEVIDWYVAHRMQREVEIVQALKSGVSTISEIVETVYREVDPALHPLAARSVGAHVKKLVDEGRVSIEGDTIELNVVSR